MKRERPLVLAVDDEPANLALLRKLLQQQGYDLAEAIDGPSAVAAVQASDPDLVLLDIQMPGFDGVEACQRIRSDPRFTGLPKDYVDSNRQARIFRPRSGASAACTFPWKPIGLGGKLPAIRPT